MFIRRKRYLFLLYLSNYPSRQNRQKKTVWPLLLCQKYTPTDCFFGVFVH